MAYRKKRKTRGKVSNRYASASNSRRSSSRRSSRRRNSSTGNRSQTLRIVVEQSGPSDPVQAMTQQLSAPSTPRKARF